MKKIVASYENVVVPGEPIRHKSSGVQKNEVGGRKKLKDDEDLPKYAKKDRTDAVPAGRQEQSSKTLKMRADKLAEDPFVTEDEMSSMEGGSKENKKNSDSDSGDSQENNTEKNEKDEVRQAKKELNVLVSRSDKILLKAKGIFPLDFFPNTLIIDANKVDVIIKTFFATETVTSIMIKEIMDVRVEATLFMGKLIIDYGPHPLKIWTVYIPALKRRDALKAKEIIDGMLILYRGENIDTTRLKPEDTIDEIKEVGKIEERE